MLVHTALGFTTLLTVTQLALAAPSRLEHEPNVRRSPNIASRPVCQTRYGPKSPAEGAIPINPQTATTACPVYANQTIEIPVFPYVPYRYNKTLENNYFNQTHLMKGINDINRLYAQYKPRIRFKMQPPKYKLVTTDAEWAYLHSIDPYIEQDIVDLNEKLTIPARGTLAQRGSNQMRELWLYVLPQLGFPFLHDGVYMSARTWFRDQATFAHEIGHWLRLRHTFDGGCTGTDFVSDTPPWDYIPGEFNALLCKGSEGYDWNKIENPCGRSKGEAIKNIKNIMSYSDDHCQSEFTWGQRKRYWDAATNYRVFKPICGPVQ
ncbi:hypothetical protein OIV83_005570 [Microbotryomycetes sp. JL201]|nr:hypothetical protein OIV83_005570 [Microbotryomycetes sp. JL201]